MVKKGRGGRRAGAGRKPKDQELNLILVLDKYIDPDKVAKKLLTLINKGNLGAIKLYLEYRAGKPVETIDLNQRIEDYKPVLNIGFSSSKNPEDLE